MSLDNMNLTITLDTEEAKDFIADCLDPGAVLLPVSTVAALYDEHGIKIRDLVRLGGIVAEDEVMQ